jgi:ABC-type sugar transport system substrate-binding protein
MNKISRRDFLKVTGIAAAALGMTACGAASSTAASTAASTASSAAASSAAASTAAGGTISVGFAQVGHESDWRAASTNSAKDVFSAANGYDLQFNDADNDSAAQLEAVRGFIEQQVDYIIVDPIVATGWDTVLQEASDAGIPVFIIDRTVDASDSLYVAWYGSDFTAEGESAGAWLQAYLEAKGKTGDVNIAVIAGSNGSSAQIGRTKGFDEYVDKNTNWKKLDEQDGDFTQDGGQTIMESYLKSYDTIDVVVCQNDNEAFGAIDALKAAGKTYGKDGDIIIISFDATNAGLTEVLNGNINADFECNPMAAPFVAEGIQTLQGGGTIANKINYVDEACFACDDTVKSITITSGSKDMTVMTQDVLSARGY